MKNSIQLQTVQFYGTDLITLKFNDMAYTAVRPIVEALGLSWGSQSAKLNKNKDKFNCFDIETVGADGKIREMLCMPLKKLNGWLFSINPEKVRPDLKEKVIRYQEECFEALYNYWHFGKAERQQLALPEPEKTYDTNTTAKEIHELVWLLFSHEQMRSLLEHLYKPLEAIGSRYSGAIYGNYTEYKRHYDKCLPILKRFVEQIKADNPKAWEGLQYRLNAK